MDEVAGPIFRHYINALVQHNCQRQLRIRLSLPRAFSAVRTSTFATRSNSMGTLRLNPFRPLDLIHRPD
jgi:hypothetical protein